MANVHHISTNDFSDLLTEERLERYEQTPLFQEKIDTAKAILAECPPYDLIQELENERIYTAFVNGEPVESIAEKELLSVEDVLNRLKEIEELKILNSDCEIEHPIV